MERKYEMVDSNTLKIVENVVEEKVSTYTYEDLVALRDDLVAGKERMIEEADRNIAIAEERIARAEKLGITYKKESPAEVAAEEIEEK